MRNAHWQFLALDTAYVDHRLPSDGSENHALLSQWNWLVDKLKGAGSRNTVLLSHHQPLSAFTEENTAASELRHDVSKLYLTIQPASIFAWFFGHEHRCTIYDDGKLPGYKARLIGNGCIPHVKQTQTQAEPGCAPFTKVNTDEYPPGSGVAISGFALLTLEGPNLSIEYINEDGSPFHQETWTMPAPMAAAAKA